MKTGRRSKNDPATIARCAEAVRLRAEGHNYDEIARLTGFASKSGAYHAVARSLKRTLQEPCDELRKLELERLDGLLRQLFKTFNAGDMRLSDNILRVLDRRWKLTGLDVPQRGEPFGSEGERINMIMFTEPQDDDIDDADHTGGA